MCQATVFRVHGGEKEEIIREVVSMERTKEGWIVRALLEEPRELRGRIQKIDFLKHTVTIQEGL